jgi:hypothetical protein
LDEHVVSGGACELPHTPAVHAATSQSFVGFMHWLAFIQPASTPESMPLSTPVSVPVSPAASVPVASLFASLPVSG